MCEGEGLDLVVLIVQSGRLQLVLAEVQRTRPDAEGESAVRIRLDARLPDLRLAVGAAHGQCGRGNAGVVFHERPERHFRIAEHAIQVLHVVEIRQWLDLGPTVVERGKIHDFAGGQRTAIDSEVVHVCCVLADRQRECQVFGLFLVLLVVPLHRAPVRPSSAIEIGLKRAVLPSQSEMHPASRMEIDRIRVEVAIGSLEPVKTDELVPENRGEFLWPSGKWIPLRFVVPILRTTPEGNRSLVHRRGESAVPHMFLAGPEQKRLFRHALAETESPVFGVAFQLLGVGRGSLDQTDALLRDRWRKRSIKLGPEKQVVVIAEVGASRRRGSLARGIDPIQVKGVIRAGGRGQPQLVQPAVESGSAPGVVSHGDFARYRVGEGGRGLLAAAQDRVAVEEDHHPAPGDIVDVETGGPPDQSQVKPRLRVRAPFGQHRLTLAQPLHLDPAIGQQAHPHGQTMGEVEQRRARVGEPGRAEPGFQCPSAPGLGLDLQASTLARQAQAATESPHAFEFLAGAQ